MVYHLDLLEQGAASLGIILNDRQKEQFITYYEFLIEKNQVMNLTAITVLASGENDHLEST